MIVIESVVFGYTIAVELADTRSIRYPLSHSLDQEEMLHRITMYADVSLAPAVRQVGSQLPLPVFRSVCCLFDGSVA